MIITLHTLMYFRESFLNAIDRLLRPYYNKLSLVFGRNGEISEDDDSEEQVFAEFDEERGVIFYPPVYLQRYAAVSDCLIDERWKGKLEKVVDLGYHDMGFIKYLKDVQGIKCILGVDIESIPLHCSMDPMSCDEYMLKKDKPLQVTLFKGNAADPDYRLIGCDAVVAIELIEHMLPHDLDRLIHTVFGFVKPRIAIFTTPNGDFNVLFKALEKNGLRRLDHFFEWSREQFHDWCSNIVARYPHYTVSCKGIGPGPIGTKHLGCCSQMALFVAKEYNKQQDLDLNSLALVADTPCPNSISNLISSWESTEVPNECNMIGPPQNMESYPELYSAKQSSITIVPTSPSNSVVTTPWHQDKNSQCNLDTESEKSYLMFDYDKEMCFDVVMPRRNIKNRVYYIEDVNNRLNCTTLQVKKFSKTTQNLMAKNKMDTLVHTKEVVDEIRHLTKMLNFDKERKNQLENGTHTWCNINWGENAPYWNQYYKIVKEYNYPFEIKSDECRILDLILDEINRVIDSKFDENVSLEVNKLEIPIERLMHVVEHITDDVEKVKDLLEWNGYELVDNMVIYSRLIVDHYSAGTHEGDSQEMDMYSDWGSTDIRSTSMSDGSTIVPDPYARCLRRAIDQKVRKLRSMLTADEDVTNELDRVVCRLMKLALRTSKGRNTPPPTRWMQCKLLDLLILTEKAIERRKRHFIESYPLKAINYEEKTEEMIALEKIKEDNTALKIVDKYEHLINQTGVSRTNCQFLNFDLDDDLSISSPEFAKGYKFTEHSSSLIELEDKLPDTKRYGDDDVTPKKESKLERTQAWVEEDIEMVPYADRHGNFEDSFVEKDHNNTRFNKHKNQYKGKPFIELNCVICKRSHSKMYKQNRTEERSKENSKTKLVKKVSRKKSSNNSLGVRTNNKYVSVDYKTNKGKPRRKQHKTLYPTVSKGPIPVSLIELCNSGIMVANDMGSFNSRKVDNVSYEMQSEVAATKQSMLIDIVTDDGQETIALRRTIGTDADADSMTFEDETLVRSFSNTLMNDDDLFEKHNVATENVHSQTIFLYDIDEPTTSKGIRHVGMDVQCGPDATVPVYSMLSAATSLTRMSKMLTVGIKIGNSTTDTQMKSTDFGTCISDADNSHKTIIPRKRSTGIKIKDSNSNLLEQMEYSFVPVSSTLSATTSLTTMPKIFSAEIRNGDSTTDTIETSTECGNAENICKLNLLREGCIDVEINTNIPKQTQNSTETQKSFALSSASSPHQYSEEEMTVRSIPREASDRVKIKDSDSNCLVDVNGFLTNTQKRSYDKTNCLSQQLNKKEITSPFAAPTQRLDDMNFDSNLPKQMEFPTNIQKSFNNISISAHKQNKKDTKLSKRVAKRRSVDFKFKDFGSGLRTQESYDKSNGSSKPLLKSKLSKSMSNKIPVDFPINDFVSNLPIQPQCLTNTQESCDRPNASSLHQFSIETTILESESKERPDAIDIEEKYLPHELECPINSQESTYDKSNTLLKPSSGLKTDDTKSDFCVKESSLQPSGCCKIDTHNTLQTNHLDVMCNVNKIIESPGPRPGCKYVKPKLCNGGVQVHSYKDKQTLSEDIMYQGEWQRNRPKVLTRRKYYNPHAPTKIDCHLKKKANSKEKIKIKTLVKEHNKNIVIKNVKPEPKKSLQPRNVTLTNSKQISNEKEKKQNLKPPKTAGVATLAKPFRNILKVPSNFPMSSSPHKNLKSQIIAKKPQINPNQTVQDDKIPRKNTKKNYIPLYLRRKALHFANDINKKDLNLSIDSVKSEIKNSKEKPFKPLIRSKTDEIKRDLVKFQTKASKQYVVYSNEIDTKRNDRLQMKNTPGNAKNSDERSISPTSQKSSTSSSPCSIETVKAVSTQPKNETNFPHSAPSYRQSTEKMRSESTTPDRKAKTSKRCKSAVRTIAENKENIPQTSKQLNISKKDCATFGKGIFMGQTTDVYVAHVKENSPLQSTANTLSKHKSQKSNVNNIPKAVSINEKRSSPHRSPSPSIGASVKFDASLITRNDEISEAVQTSNMVLVIAPQARELHIPTDNPQLENANLINHRLITDWIDNNDKEAIDSHASHNITSAVREIIDETLDFIDDPFDNRCLIDSETVIPCLENLNSRADLSESPTSFKTIITSDDNYYEIPPSEIELALSRSFETPGDESIVSLNDTRLTVTDFDALSFKSLTSESKMSGYLSADNEFSSSIKLPKYNIPVPNSTSVREIFERKDQPFQTAQFQNTAGSLANQAFSGFTINGDPVSGDRPDLINFIDSETGSLAVNVARQATSEELLISGRSSDSFESCVLDDDTVVPNWLFQMISQQQSAMDELEPPAELMGSMPVAEPMYDENGNTEEVPGLGAGAGDGRGMHSDQSQDSSGRGTSVSSSEFSSGPESEAILIDPSAFVAQFEMLRDAVASSIIVLAIDNPVGEILENAAGNRQGPVEMDPLSFSHGESRRSTRAPLTTASDVDADVSSLDTDAPDSSDN